jgi:Zn-dependent protease
VASEVKIHAFYPIFALWGVPVLVHWSVAALLVVILVLSLSGGLSLLFLAVAYFALILVHEFGHVSVARRLGYRVHSVSLSLIHGRCSYDAPHSRYDESVVAWGGVSAQATILLPAAALWSAAGSSLPDVVNLALGLFTYYNAALILFNLSPVPPFDGAAAWGLFRERRKRHNGRRRRP